MTCSNLSRQLKSEVNLIRSDHNCGKVDKKLCWKKIAIRNFTEIIKSSRAVLFPTENIANSYESFIAVQERTLIGQVDESNCPVVQKTKLLESKLFT